MLEWMTKHPRLKVVGIGLDGAERAGPPLAWIEAWRQAGRAGYRRTAHLCEDNQTLFEGPPEHFTHCRDALGCERLDHGYNVLANPAIVERAVREQVPFTMACWSSTAANRVPRQNRIKRMFEAGASTLCSARMTQPCSQRLWAIAGARCSRPANGTSPRHDA